MWKLIITPVDHDCFTTVAQTYEIGEGCLYLLQSEPGEPVRRKIFPLSALLEITLEEQP